uniref:MFS domain-containing protein n=1 Tax=Trichuris muris TaxID=70415 RepID=A0A5S6Q5R7_TRIMR
MAEQTGVKNHPFEGVPKWRQTFLRIADENFCCRYYPKRWLLAALCHIGFAISFGIRCNFGAAKIVLFGNFTGSGENDLAHLHAHGSAIALLESSFFYGCCISVLPAGILAAKYSSVRLLGFGVGLLAALNLFLPWAFRFGLVAPVLIQFVQGIAQGLLYPCMLGIWSVWAPISEKTKLATTSVTGNYVGVFVGIPLSALLVSHFGWSAPFYVYGSCGLIWYVFWSLLAVSKPSEHPTLCDKEKELILRGRQSSNCTNTLFKMRKVPWRAILSSPPVWALIVATFSRCWIMYTLINDQLSFMSDTLGFTMDASAILASIPHALMSITVIASGQVADCLRNKHKLATTTVRKISHCTGISLEATFLFICAFVRDKTLAVTSLILARACSGLAVSGSNVNHLDLTQRYASILTGICQTFGYFAGILTPLVTENVLAATGIDGWKIAFSLAAVIQLISVLIYGVFASGEIQSWG